MNKYLDKLYKYFEELSSKFEVTDVIKLLYDFAIILLVLTIILSIVMMIITYFRKKEFNIKYIYAILIAISIYSFISLLYYLMIKVFNLMMIIKYFSLIIIPIIIVLIIHIIIFFVKEREKPKKINYIEFKNNLLIQCDNCKREYRQKDIAINEDDYHLCKVCQKEKENSK